MQLNLELWQTDGRIPGKTFSDYKGARLPKLELSKQLGIFTWQQKGPMLQVKYVIFSEIPYCRSKYIS